MQFRSLRICEMAGNRSVCCRDYNRNSPENWIPTRNGANKQHTFILRHNWWCVAMKSRPKITFWESGYMHNVYLKHVIHLWVTTHGYFVADCSQYGQIHRLDEHEFHSLIIYWWLPELENQHFNKEQTSSPHIHAARMKYHTTGDSKLN